MVNWLRLWFMLLAGLCLLPAWAEERRYSMLWKTDGCLVCSSRYQVGSEERANVAGMLLNLELPSPRMVLRSFRIQLLDDFRQGVPDYNHVAAYVLNANGIVLGKSREVAQNQDASVTFRFEDNPVVLRKNTTYYVYFVKGLQDIGSRRYFNGLVPGMQLKQVEAVFGEGRENNCKGNYLRIKLVGGQSSQGTNNWGLLKVCSQIGEPVPFKNEVPLVKMELEKAQDAPLPGEVVPHAAFLMPGAEPIMLKRLEKQISSIQDRQERKEAEEVLAGLRKVSEGENVNTVCGEGSNSLLAKAIKLYGTSLRSVTSPEAVWYLLLNEANVDHVSMLQTWMGSNKMKIARLLEVRRKIKSSKLTEKLRLERERQELLDKLAPDWGRAFFDPARGITYEELLRRLKKDQLMVPHDEIFTFTPESSGLYRVAGAACVRAEGRMPTISPDPPSCFVLPGRERGEVVARTSQVITIRWERGTIERFVRQVDGRYHREDISLCAPETPAFESRVRELLHSSSQKQWHEVVTLVRPEGRKEYSVAGSLAKDVRTGEEAEVVKRGIASIVLKWEASQPETYHLQPDGTYALDEASGFSPVDAWNDKLRQDPGSLAHEQIILVAPVSYSKIWMMEHVAYFPGVRRPWVEVLFRDADSVVLQRYFKGGQVYVKQAEPEYFRANYFRVDCSEKTWHAPRADKNWKRYCAEVKRMFRDKADRTAHETQFLWVESGGKPAVAELWVSGGVAYLPQSGELAEIVEWDKQHLVLDWDGGRVEHYDRQGDGSYGRVPRKRVSSAESPGKKLKQLKEALRDQPGTVPHEQIRLVNPGYPQGSTVLRVSGEAGCRPQTNSRDTATVRREGSLLYVYWDKWGDDIYRKQADGRYYHWDFVPKQALGNGEYWGDPRYEVLREPGKSTFLTSQGDVFWTAAVGGVSFRLSGDRPMELESLSVELASDACRAHYGRIGAYVLDENGVVLDKTDQVEWQGKKVRFSFPDKRARLEPNLSYMVYFDKEIRQGDAFSKLRVGDRVSSPDSSFSGIQEKAKGNHLLLRVMERKDPYTVTAWGLLAPSRRLGEVMFRYNAPLMEIVTACEGGVISPEEERKTLKAKLKRDPNSVPHETVRLQNPSWFTAGESRQEDFYLVGKYAFLARLMDEAEIVDRDDRNLVLYWFRWNTTEHFVKQPNGVFLLKQHVRGRDETKLPSRPASNGSMAGKAMPGKKGRLQQDSASVPHEVLTLVNQGWGTDQLYISGQDACRASGRKDTATITKKDDVLEIVWDAWEGVDIYRRLEDGRYYHWDTVPGKAEEKDHFQGVQRCRKEGAQGKQVIRTTATGNEWGVAAGGVVFQMPRGGKERVLDALSVRIWHEPLRHTADYRRLGAYILDEEGRILDKTREVAWKGDQVRFLFSNQAARLEPGKCYHVYFVKGINSIYADDYYSSLKPGAIVKEPDSSVQGCMEGAKGNHLPLRVVEGVDPRTAQEWGLLEPSRRRGALSFRYDAPLMQVETSPFLEPESAEDDGDDGDDWLLFALGGGLALGGLAGIGFFLWHLRKREHQVEKPTGW